MEQLSNQESPEQKQERIKFFISKFLEDKLTQAVQLKKEAIDKGEEIDIVQCLQNVWPENDGVPWQRKPRFTIPELDEELSIRFENDTNEYDQTSKTLTLGLGSLREADTPEELDQAMIKILEAVYHEVEHIYNPGSHLVPQDVQETIEYLGNPGEIEAHARQFAYRYMKEFPGEQFDVIRMTELAEKIKERGESNKHHNYFVVFADPEKQEKYKEFGDIKTINEKVTEATRRHFQILSEKSGI